ncbi:acyl carrier protein [Streptomyces sp. NPDC050264]|uniref:acyl carrier protein n=1 Tax=Streptomyces sp. NPDC050264 TaxID=3155038 RepID=UPI003439F7FB
MESNAQDTRAIAVQIAEVFQEVLGAVEVPDTAGGFLDMGGDSLTAQRAVALLSSQLGVRVTVRDLFRAHSADALALVAARRLAS